MTQRTLDTIAARIRQRDAAIMKLEAQQAQAKLQWRVQQLRVQKQHRAWMLRQIAARGVDTLTDAEFVGALCDIQMRMQDATQRAQWQARGEQDAAE
jgi:hypothetical protein